MGEYTAWTLVSMGVVVVLEVLVLRTGIFRRLQYWLAMAIMFAFQFLVDGWLTKLSDPIVIYHPEQISGVRLGWGIPIEDFGFAFAMCTLTIALWCRLGRRKETADA